MKNPKTVKVWRLYSFVSACAGNGFLQDPRLDDDEGLHIIRYEDTRRKQPSSAIYMSKAIHFISTSFQFPREDRRRMR